MTDLDADRDRVEMRRLSQEYRDKLSRLLRSTHEDVDRNVVRLLSFIDESPFLSAIVNGAAIEFLPDDELTKQAVNRDLQPPIDEVQEVAYVCHLLRVLTRQPKTQLWQWVYRYGGSRSDDSVRTFLSQVAAPALEHLGGMIARRYIELGGDRVSGPHFTFRAEPGGVVQANVAQNGGSVTAHQVIGNAIEIRRAASALLAEIESAPDGSLSTEAKEELVDLGSMTIDELGRPDPSPSRLRTIGKNLMRAVETVNASQSVYDCAVTLGTLLLFASLLSHLHK